MAYFLLSQGIDGAEGKRAFFNLIMPANPSKESYSTIMEVQDAAKAYLGFHPAATLVVVQDVATVVLAPVVTMLNPPPAEIRHNLGPVNGEPSGLPAPTVPHRTEPERPNESSVTPSNLAELNRQIAEEAKKGPPREPRAGKRLLIRTTGTPTNQEMLEYKMIVVGTVVVKNAFGALEFDDLPLTNEERLELKNALHL